ncbi:phage head closure protein [Rhizobium halophytocola]|uniref:SPP1 family predicted phage head-tail adaptor n=1 Tax=Rhizobium halophytocola TaxID=735519 RepID=A0ABS4DVG8_9HYPH|nr:phage head closure protein [Rhizobium halophytocola]MBP1849691.1 SPP1 family predicted phage head-tail adaptor [Rhizobium halophytocola]
MRAGKLDRRLSLLEWRETGRDELNQPIEDWVAVKTVWGQQRPERGAERFSAAQIAGSTVLTFHIRYFGTISVQDRIRYEGKDYEVSAPARELGRHVGLEIDCIAVAE